MASSLTKAIRDFVNQNNPQTTTSQPASSLTNEVRSFVNDPQGYTQSRNQEQFNPNDWDDRNVLGKIYDMMTYNPQKAKKLYSDYRYLQADPTSRYYNPYSTATNRSVSNLNSYGIDTSNIDDDWFRQNDYLRQYLIYDGTTNTPSKPGKKASAAQKAAYEYYQIWKSEDATRKAENQWDQLQKEITYWAQRTDRNYSDEEVLAKIDWSKYGELTSMDANKAMAPNEYNRAIGYSQAAMYGVLWNARNPGTNVDPETAMALSALGRGNTWKENKEIAAKLNAGNIETYSPYSVGSTMEKQGLYFGVDHFDRKWLEEHRAEILNGGDETAKKYYADIVEAVDYTEKLNDELTSMREQIDNLLKYYTDPEQVINLIKGNTTAYGDLFALDKTLETGELKNTTSAVDYRWRDIEKEIRERCAEAKGKSDAISMVTGLVTSGITAAANAPTTGVITEPSVTAEDEIGQFGKGNIDLYNRPKVVNEDGSTSTVRSMSFYDEGTGKEILIPTVIDGEVVSDEEAIDHYYATGEYLGMFDTPEEATEYALDLHKQQAAYYGLKDEEEEAEQEQVTEAPETVYDVLDEARRLLQQSQIVTLPNTTAGTGERTILPDFTHGQAERTNLPYTVDKDALRAAYDEKHGDGAFDRDLEAVASTATPVNTPGFARGPLPQPTATPVNTQAVTPAEMAGSTSAPVIDQEGFRELALQEPVAAPVFTETEIALEKAGQAARDEIGPTVMEEGTKAEQTALLTGNTSYYDACVRRLRDRVGDFGIQVKSKAKDGIIFDYGSQYSVTKGYEDHEANLAEKQAKLEEITPELDDLERKIAVLADEDMTDEEYRNLKALSELTGDENWDYWRDVLTRYDGYGSEDFPDDYQRELYDQALGVVYGRVRNDYTSDEEIIRRRGTQWWNLIKDGPLTDAPTAEDVVRAEELNTWKTALEDEIAAERDYLIAHEGEYDDARKNRNFSRLMYEAACALPGNEDLDPMLFDKVESVYNIADTPTPSAYSPYNYYDLTVEYAGVDRAQATNNAKSDAGLLSASADDLAEMTSYLEDLGVTFTDDQQKNITANIAYMRNQSMDATYVAMDGNEDFDAVVAENKSRIESSEVVGMINKARKVSPNLNVGVDGLSGIVGVLSDINQLTGFAVNTGEMTPEEWDRFYYLFGADGTNKEAAQAYLDHILDPEKGAVTVRASIDKAQWFEEQGKTNPLTGFLAARGMKILAAPSALMYRVSQKIQGKEVSPYSKYYDPMKAGMAADQGAKTALVDAVGGSDSTLGKLVGFGYDGGASVLDMIMARRISGFMVGEVANFVSTSRLGTKIVELAGRANRTGNEAFNRALQTGASLGMEGQELVNTAYAAAAAAAKVSDAGKALSVINVAEKAAINASYALPMAFSAAEQEYWKVLLETEDEGKAEAMLATKFGTSMLTYMVIGKNFHKGYTANPDDFVDGVKTFFKQLGSTEAAVGASSLVSNIIDENVERIVLGADSRWGKNKAKYYELYKSDAIAEKLADDDMKNDIIGGTLNSMIVAAFRQSASFAIGSARNASGRSTPTATEEIGLSVRGITEESVNEPTSIVPITEESVNVGPVLGLPSNTWGTPVADAKDTDTIMSVYGSTPTAGATGLASILNTGNPAAEKASAQIIVGDLCYGDTRVAAMTMQQFLDLGVEKDAIIKASLTDGAANAALRSCFDKTRSGLPLTQDDVSAVASGLAADISTNPRGFDESLQMAIKENRIANRTTNIAAANSKSVKTAEADVEKAKSTLATAQETLDAANDNFAVAQDNAQAALDNFRQDPQNKEALGPVEQTQNHLIGADTQVQEAQKAVEVQERKVAAAEKDLQDVRRETMTQARTQAMAEVDQEIQAEAEVAYNNGIATLQPLAPFGQSVRVISSSGQPVMLTGMYDSIPRRMDVYTTEDGGLITTDAVNTEDIDEADNNFWRTSSDFQLSGQHPANAPKVYFPASFEASVAGKPVQMIGIVGKEVVDGMTDPVIMDLGGHIYSINDSYVDIPNDYIDTVYDALEVDGVDLPIITDIPAVTVEVNEDDNTGSEQVGTEPASETGTTLSGSAGTRDNTDELSSASERNDGSGDLSDAGSDGGEGIHGLSPESIPETVRPDIRRAPERLLSQKQRNRLRNKNVTGVALQNETDRQRFSSALDAARENNPYKLFVDPQTPEQLEEKGTIMLISRDGKIVGAVGTKGIYNGDIFAVCKAPDSKAKKASANIIISAIAQGGNKLDCYNGTEENPGLPLMYSSVGMIPVARVKFNRDFADPEWNYERDGEPDVVFWQHCGDDADTVISKLKKTEDEGGYHLYRYDDINKLPVFNDMVCPDAFYENGEPLNNAYDIAWRFRDNMLAGKYPEGFQVYPNGNIQLTDWTNNRDVTIVGATITDEGTNYVTLDGESIPSTNFNGGTNSNDSNPNNAPFESWLVSLAEADTGAITPTDVNAEVSEPSESAEITPADVNAEQVEASEITPADVNAEPSEPTESSGSTPPPVNRPPERVAPPPERDGVSDFEIGQRQWGREGAQQSDILHKQTKERLLNNNEYLKDHNADQIDRALTWIGDHSTQSDPSGLYGAIAEIESEGFNLWSTDGQVRMMAAINMAAEAGDLETEGRLSDVLFNRTGTDLGQAMQARKIWMTMTPTGRKHALQREARKIQEEYRVQGKKVDLKISDETLEAAANAKNNREFAEARRKMEKELSAQIPSDWKLKMRTIRMTSMLANPRTHIRNLEGNTAFIPMIEAKNAIATGLERINGLEKGERTKSIWRTKESKEFAKRDAEIMKPELQGTAKYYEMNAVERDRKAFGTKNGPISKTIGKAYQKFADFSSDMLEKEDWLFLNYHYQRALSGYMTANGYTEKDMKGETLNKARAYAILEAQKATYRDPNTLAKWLSDQKNKPEAVQFVINAVQPFVKTPANIMRRGIEYNPVGLMASLITKKRQLEAYKEWEDSGFEGDKPKGAKSPSEVWDSVAAGMTGTMLAGLGAWLASLGILKVKASDTEKLHGSQDYSLEIDGKSYGIGNIIPMNIPLLLGASIFNEVEEGAGEINGFKDVFARSLSAISDILEPVVDTTMMTSLNSLLDTSRYSGDGDLTLSVLGQKILANYVSSYVPSIVGSAAKVIDTTRRKAYVETGDPLPIWSAMFEQMQNKIPFLSTQNVPYVDAWGNEEETDRFTAFLQNFILPDKVQDLTDSELDSKLEELYEITGEAVLPKTAEKKITVNGESIKLNDQQWYEYGRVKGQSAREALQELIERPEFILLSDSPEVQAELVKKVYTYAKAKAAKAVFPEREVKDSWTNGALTADNVVDYIFQKEEEAAKKESITVHKKDLNKALADFDLETAKTNVDYLRQAGVKDSSIKSSVSEYFKPLYKEAYERGDREEMLRIQAILQGCGLGYENYKFDNWLK